MESSDENNKKPQIPFMQVLPVAIARPFTVHAKIKLN
jgi:hypothetical protein